MWRTIAIAAVIIGGLISALVAHRIAGAEREAAQNQWSERAEGVLTRIEGSMRAHVDCLGGLADAWGKRTIPVRPEWQADVAALRNAHPGLVGCELLTPEKTVKFASPDTMFSYGPGLAEESMVQARNRADDGGEPASAAVAILDAHGDASAEGFRVFVPIENPTFHSTMVTGLISPSAAIKGLLNAEEARDFKVALSANGAEVLPRSQQADLPTVGAGWQHAGVDWKLNVDATSSPKAALSRLPGTVLGFGLLTSLLLGLALWAMDLFLRRKRVAEIANSKLRVEMEQKERTMEQLKLTEDELHRAQRMEVLGKLTGGIAHEFNNLFTAVRGFLSLAQDDLPVNHAIQQDLKLASEASVQASDLAGYLMEYSRSSSDEIKPVALNPVLERFELFLKRALGQEFTVNMELDDAARDGCILTSLFDFQQTLMDLAALAKDRMPAAGVLAIRTRSVSETADNNVPIADDRLKLSFYLPMRDGADGIDAEMNDCLNGIRERIDRVGGELELQTGADGVCTVSLTFPNVAHRVTMPGIPKGEELVRSDATVLLVEDDTRVLAFATRILECMGCDVVSAETPTDALIAGREMERIDLLVTDIALPEISGTELYDRLRAKNPGLKCLFVSGYEENELRQSWLRDRTDPVLAKPFTLPSLSRAVAELVEGAA